MLFVSWLLIEAAVCLQQHGATFATVVFFLKKSTLPNFESKKEKHMKKYPFGIKFHSVFVIALGIKFRKVYIFFLFYFQNFGGSLPASSSASARCTDIKKKRDTSLLFSFGHVCHRSEYYKKKKWNLIPLRRAYEWPKESARTSTRLL